MTQNFLSNQPDTQEAAALQKKTGQSQPVAFRVPVPEEKKIDKVTPPLPKGRERFENTSALQINTVPKKEAQTRIGSTPIVVMAQSIKTPSPAIAQKKSEDNFTKPEEEVHKGFGVNILGGAPVAKKEVSLTQLATFVGGAAGIALVALGVWFWVLAVEKGDLARTQGERAARVAELKQFLATVKDEKKQIESQRKTIATARELLSQHLYWTRFFRFLEAVTLPDVYYTNLSVDPSGRIRLAAVGRDFSAVARQLLAMEEAEDVETVRMSKAAAETTGAVPGVQFDLEIAVKPALLFFRE